MTSVSFADILDRHFKMNKDYSLDLVLDLLQAEKELDDNLSSVQINSENKIPDKWRKKLIEWIIKLCDELKLSYKTKQTALILVDICLLKLKIHKNFLQLLGITCIFVSVKSEESFIYTLPDACKHCADVYSREEVSAMEMLILKTLKWKIHYPTPGELARRFIHVSDAVQIQNMPKFFKKVDNFIDFCLLENELSMYPPSCIAVASIMCAFENAHDHIVEWRKLMMTNGVFKLDFNKIDFLYKGITHEILKASPDYFNSTMSTSFEKDDKQSVKTANSESAHVDNYGNETSVISLGSQETYIEPNNNDLILENISYTGTPNQENKSTPKHLRASLVDTEKLIRNGSRMARSARDENKENYNPNIMDEEKCF